MEIEARHIGNQFSKERSHMFIKLIQNHLRYPVLVAVMTNIYICWKVSCGGCDATVEMIIDTGASTDILDEGTFDKVNHLKNKTTDTNKTSLCTWDQSHSLKY